MAKTKDIDSVDGLIEFIKGKKGDSITLGESDKLFERYGEVFKNLKSTANYVPATGEFRVGKVDGLKAQIEHSEVLQDLIGDLGNNAGDMAKQLERKKDGLKRNFGTVVRELDRIDHKIQQSGEKLGQDMERIQRQMTKAFESESKKLNIDLASATTEAGKTKAKEALEGLNSRYKDATKELSGLMKDKHSDLSQMRGDLNRIVEEAEKATGMSASEFRKTSKVASVVGSVEKNAEGAAKEGNALVRFAKGNPIKTALGAVAAGAVGAMLLRGGNRQEQVAR